MPGHLIRRLNQLSTHIFAARIHEAGFQLTPVQFAALDAIISRPDQDQASIAAMIAYDRATVGGVIDRLEQKGLVERTISKKDRRAREVRITRKGRRTFEQVLPIVVSVQEDILVGLQQGERELFVSLARKAIGRTPEAGTDTR